MGEANGYIHIHEMHASNTSSTRMKRMDGSRKPLVSWSSSVAAKRRADEENSGIAARRADRDRGSANKHMPQRTQLKSSVNKMPESYPSTRELQLQEELAGKAEEIRTLSTLNNHIQMEYDVLKDSSSVEMDALRSRLLSQADALESLRELLKQYIEDKQALEIEIRNLNAKFARNERLGTGTASETVYLVVEHIVERVVCGAYKSLALAEQQAKASLANSNEVLAQRLKCMEEDLADVELLETVKSNIFDESILEYEEKLAIAHAQNVHFEGLLMKSEDERVRVLRSIELLTNRNNQLEAQLDNHLVQSCEALSQSESTVRLQSAKILEMEAETRRLKAELHVTHAQRRAKRLEVELLQQFRERVFL